MDKLISYCGLNCAECGAYLAMKNNDQSLREQTAALWKEIHGADYTPEMINCVSCKGSGVLVPHCTECEVRRCAIEKGVANCGVCAEFKTCKTINDFYAQVPPEMKGQLLENLGQN
jgi:hypothetical protein